MHLHDDPPADAKSETGAVPGARRQAEPARRRA
jgi:hypothetical protein